MQTLQTFANRFWQHNGQLQNYIDFILCEIDPLFSRQRIGAEVLQIINETDDTKTLLLRPAARWEGFKPGQYISIELEINGVRMRRNYSVSSAPKLFRDKQIFSITVKDIEGGVVSTYLNNNVHTKDVVYISAANGRFLMDDLLSVSITPSFSGLLFIAAGSGITPIMSMIEQIKEHKPDTVFTLIYYTQNQAQQIFSKPLNELKDVLPNFSFIPHFTKSEGRITKAQLKADCPDITTRNIYLCGPEDFMSATKEYAFDLGVAEKALKCESFGASTHIKTYSTGQVGVVSFNQSGHTIQSTGQNTLLELAELAGLNPKYGCRNGLCFECKCNKSEGRVMNSLTGELVPQDQPQIQACISVPVGDVSISNL